MRRNAVVMAMLFVAVAGGSDARAQEARDFRWTGRLSAGQSVEIRNVNGRIAAEPASGAEVEVLAVRKAGRYGEIEDVRIEAVPHRDGVTVCAIYPSRRASRSDRCERGSGGGGDIGDTDVSVDFVVRVPRGVHFVGNNIAGSIFAANLPSNATVSTISGNIDVSAAGVVEAKTISGSIEARMGSARPGRDLRFKTISGNITLSVPADFEAEFDASSLSGGIRSDFPIRIHQRRWVGTDAQGRIGTGSYGLSMETISGSIALLKSR